MIYYLYWIRKKDFKNILTEGYVGVSKNIDKRFKEHLYKMKNNIHENKLLQRNFNKHKLIFEKILCGNKEYCFYIENKLRPSKNIGWNNNIGGTSPPSCKGKILTENHKLKISNSKKGKSRPKFSDEWKQNISNGGKGKILSKKTKEKISKTLSGQKHTEERKNKISCSLKNNKCASKKVITPDGIFLSQKDAALFYDVSQQVFGKWINKKEGFYNG